MTDFEKTRISEMRTEGRSYAEIAAALGLKAGSVKVFCQRSHLGGIRSAVGRTAHGRIAGCEQCGQTVRQQEGRKRKRFCSDACRMAWWSAHRSNVRQKTMHSFICEYCGKEFSLYGVTSRKYCSHGCYVRGRFSAAGKEGVSV